MTDSRDTQTLGDVKLPRGVTHDDLEDARATLARFDAVAVDEFGRSPNWLITTLSVVSSVARQYDESIADQ